ncbi:MAG: 3-hydroxyacyl-ACP dehydratase FabZ [Gallicola sp.]|nr:3-hydroxyacyl-ACP dehydratase FabZ [Gallicola sp.]
MELNSNEIEKIIPHRYPMLLIDKIVEVEPGIKAKSIKCVTANEPFFQGHFPQEHIMPGVLILEAMAQTGAVAMLLEEENKGKIGLFTGIKDAKFRGMVKPGDVLEIECEISARKLNFGRGDCVAKVNGEVVSKATLTFAIK